MGVLQEAGRTRGSWPPASASPSKSPAPGACVKELPARSRGSRTPLFASAPFWRSTCRARGSRGQESLTGVAIRVQPTLTSSPCALTSWVPSKDGKREGGEKNNSFSLDFEPWVYHKKGDGWPNELTTVAGWEGPSKCEPSHSKRRERGREGGRQSEGKGKRGDSAGGLRAESFILRLIQSYQMISPTAASHKTQAGEQHSHLRWNTVQIWPPSESPPKMLSNIVAMCWYLTPKCAMDSIPQDEMNHQTSPA